MPTNMNHPNSDDTIGGGAAAHNHLKGTEIRQSLTALHWGGSGVGVWGGGGQSPKGYRKCRLDWRLEGA
jgi:hypothetical protein